MTTTPVVARRWIALAALVLLGAACVPHEVAWPIERPTPPAATSAAPTPAVTPRSSLSSLAGVTPAMGTPLDDARTREVLALLLDRSPDLVRVEAALDEVVAQRDVRFIAPLIELLRAGPMQLADLDRLHVEALHALAGTTVSRGWERWVEWYGQTMLTPAPGFDEWKATLYARLDPELGQYLSLEPRTIPVDQVVLGGYTGTRVEALDLPAVVPADSDEAGYLEPREPVLGVVVNGEARAYPFRIMDVHEIANDVLGGVPITIAYCPLCGSAIAYDARGPDGAVYTFETSGLLYESNKLMYERETGTLWLQFTGRPVAGPLVASAGPSSGPGLEAFPTVIATWEDWLEQHPDTTVLDLDTGHSVGYTPGYPYLQYFTQGDPAYPVSNRDARLPAKRWVYGLDLDGAATAYDVRNLMRERVLNDQVGSQEVVLVTAGRFIVIRDELPRLGEMVYLAGGTVRAYARPPGTSFTPAGDPMVVIDQDGKVWHVTEDAIEGPGGQRAERLYGRLAYWFTWHTFYPYSAVWE